MIFQAISKTKKKKQLLSFQEKNKTQKIITNLDFFK